MKKQLVTVLMAAMLAISSLPTATAMAADTTQALAYQPFHTLNNLYIQTPSAQSTTTSSSISILGACNPAHQLYINDQLIETTTSGFFAAYLPLAIGDNYFIIKTNDESATVQVTRKAAAKKASAAPAATQALSGQYGVIKSNNITHRQGPSSETAQLLPLAKGTTVVITGQSGNYYRISDGSYIFKSAVDLYQGSPAENVLSGIHIQDFNDTHTTLAWQMPISTLYDIQLSDDQAIVTLRNTKSGDFQPALSPNPAIASIQRTSDTSAADAVYQIAFQPNAKVNGYDVSYEEGRMLLSFKQAPRLQNGSIVGARILLDAGHGGSDTGALGPVGIYGPKEKDINIQITQYAKAYLESKGAVVLMNRTGDNTSSLAQRVADIIAAQPDVMLSIHANSIANTSDLTKVKGTLTFYTFAKDQAFATAINDAVAQTMGWPATLPRTSNLALTRTTTCPAALIETKFMSNPNDYQWIIDPANQKAFGEAIGQALEQYLLQNSR